MMHGRSLANFVDDLQARGRYTFTREEVHQAFGAWTPATRASLRRLADAGRIVRPRQGFYAIVPLEYRSAGSPPASWFIDDLMRYVEQPYYVGLLSAAALYGAAHQRAQEFQVVTDRPTRTLFVARLRIRFLQSTRVRERPVRQVKTETGSIRVSTPEATALDLVHYLAPAGQMDHVATVLSELADVLDPEELTRLADTAASVEVRRLGYLLELVGATKAADGLADALGTLDKARPLEPGLPQRGAERNARWGLYVNAAIEPDEV
ncbi:MAG: type IV toxin-antitoxin system AbiEi family antitoxin [Longimicrobiales bacterium]|nr:type IV toxin-antitoxin system AbiEi family antitoxin [Longimicrobiales bacterium]